ncbi:cysteine desulfurase [Candidatus Pacearchaeota archaeon]|nr:cysteine desulfurase [Candidatus Pacearchaeota archaeon]
MAKQIYLDNAATTKVDDAVLKEMTPYFNEKYGNASSVHIFGQQAKEALEKSRKIIAKTINAKSSEIVFTSGGTESNNFAITGLAHSNYPSKNHIITTKIDHDCVLETCRYLEKHVAKVTYLDVNSEGFINPKDVEEAINDKTFLVSIIHGNNEIGTIQNIEEIGKICKKNGVLFHTDACQSFTKVPIDVKKMNIDLMTLNAHKIHGPKGVGALYIKEGIKIDPLLHGGGHERGFRSGTENVSGIVGFAKAVDISNGKDVKKMEELRDYFISKATKIEKVKLNGPAGKNRLCNNINLCIEGVEGEALGGYLENEGIFTSTGSACSSHSGAKSHVLKAIGRSDKEIASSIRISISKYTSKEDLDFVLDKLEKTIRKLRKWEF